MSETAMTSKDVACPFCGLLCDDLEISTASDGTLVSSTNACDRAKQLYGAHCAIPTAGGARINGEKTDLDSAINRVADALVSAQSTLIGGLATDIAGMRQAVALAEIANASLDHMNGRAMLRNQSVLQRTGWFTTTLTEIRNRADLVIILDSGIFKDYPRLGERILKPKEGLLPDRIDQRKVVTFDEGDSPRPEQVDACVDQVLSSGDRSMLQVLADLRQLLASDKLASDKDENESADSTSCASTLCALIKKSQYPVFIWSAGRLAPADGDIVIDVVSDIVRQLNVKSRAASLPIAGTQGDLTANQVCTWQTGFPLRVEFVDHRPQAATVSGDCATRVQNGEVDCLLWVSSFAQVSPPTGAKTTIVLGQDASKAPGADIFIPVETPGVGHPGLMVRTDNVVTVPLKAVRSTRNPEVADVLQRIRNKMITAAKRESAA